MIGMAAADLQAAVCRGEPIAARRSGSSDALRALRKCAPERYGARGTERSTSIFCRRVRPSFIARAIVGKLFGDSSMVSPA